MIIKLLLLLNLISLTHSKAKFEWINIQSISGEGYNSSFGNRFLLKNKRRKSLQYYFGLGVSPIALINPFDNFKIASFTLDVGVDRKINPRQSIGIGFGLNSTHLNNNFKTYYKTLGYKVDSDLLPYLSLNTKYKLLDNVRFIQKLRNKKTPLVVELEYTFAEHISLPTKDPMNHSFINPKAHGFRNFNIGGSIDWDF
ncbi:MAG: hypothetical protein KC646_01010 [Candidatus Cloacimonetes bacterium]|nr:hypothetical protein [Candidatus Cloacimonadota bacterium]